MPMKVTPSQLRPQPQMAASHMDGFVELSGAAVLAVDSMAEGKEAEEKKEKESSRTDLTGGWTTEQRRSEGSLLATRAQLQ